MCSLLTGVPPDMKTGVPHQLHKCDTPIWTQLLHSYLCTVTDFADIVHLSSFTDMLHALATHILYSSVLS